MANSGEKDKGNDGVSPETSKRVCQHMNEDHAVSVFAMAKAAKNLPRDVVVTEAHMKKVTLHGCQIRALSCHGDMCTSNEVEYPFDPPLKSSAELRPRLVAIHRKVCGPKAIWLINKPLALTILVTCASLGYGSVFMSHKELTGTIEDKKELNNFLSLIFGSAQNFATMVSFSFYFSVIAHALEGLYAAFYSRKALKLPWTTALQWFALVLLVGYPIMSEFQQMMKVKRAQKPKP